MTGQEKGRHLLQGMYTLASNAYIVKHAEECQDRRPTHLRVSGGQTPPTVY